MKKAICGVLSLVLVVFSPFTLTSCGIIDLIQERAETARLLRDHLLESDGLTVTYDDATYVAYGYSDDMHLWRYPSYFPTEQMEWIGVFRQSGVSVLTTMAVPGYLSQDHNLIYVDSWEADPQTFVFLKEGYRFPNIDEFEISQVALYAEGEESRWDFSYDQNTLHWTYSPQKTILHFSPEDHATLAFLGDLVDDAVSANMNFDREYSHAYDREYVCYLYSFTHPELVATCVDLVRDSDTGNLYLRYTPYVAAKVVINETDPLVQRSLETAHYYKIKAEYTPLFMDHLMSQKKE